MKIHTVTVNDGETIEQALKRALAGGPEGGVGDFALTILEGILEMQGVVGHMHDYAEKKLGRKPRKKMMRVPVLSGLFEMPVETIDPDDAEWFSAMSEGLGVILDDIKRIDLGKL